ARHRRRCTYRGTGRASPRHFDEEGEWGPDGGLRDAGKGRQLRVPEDSAPTSHARHLIAMLGACHARRQRTTTVRPPALNTSSGVDVVSGDAVLPLFRGYHQGEN